MKPTWHFVKLACGCWVTVPLTVKLTHALVCADHGWQIILFVGPEHP